MSKYNYKVKKEYYEKHKQNILSKAEVRHVYYSEQLKKLKIDMGCSICGYRKCCNSLHFHHVEPKFKNHNITAQFMQSYPKTKFPEEIAKCILVCANCHGEIHENDYN